MTVAGSQTAGMVNGIGANARFNSILSIYLSSDLSVLYVAESTNVRKVNLTTLVVSTLVTVSGNPAYI